MATCPAKWHPEERQMEPEVPEAPTWYRLQHGCASSKPLGEKCPSFPWAPKLWKDGLGWFWAHPTPLLSCRLLFSLSGHVTFATPEGGHSPQMMVPGITAAKPRLKWATASSSPSAAACTTHRMAQCRRPWLWEPVLDAQLYHLFPMTLDKWAPLSEPRLAHPGK